MTGLVGNDMSHDRHADQGKIADAVEQFVTHELIGETQPPFIQDTVAVNDDGVVDLIDFAVFADKWLFCPE